MRLLKAMGDFTLSTWRTVMGRSYSEELHKRQWDK